MPWQGGILEETIVASAARTTAGSAVGTEAYNKVDRARVNLNVSAVSGTTPNLTVFVEDSTDGVNWNTVGTFAAKTATGQETVTVNPLIGNRVRIRWAITGTTPSFTFSVTLAGESDK